MARTDSQIHCTDKYSEHSSIIWPVWPYGSLFGYELSGSGFESSCSHFTFRFRACFEQGVPWLSGNYRVWIHSETRTWHEKNIQSLSYMEGTQSIFEFRVNSPHFGLAIRELLSDFQTFVLFQIILVFYINL